MPEAAPAPEQAADPGPPAAGPPRVELPKAGGAIRDMGEKFGTNPVNGTGVMTVPIVLTAGRGGFGPQLALSYDSGAGNGPFGFGWRLSSSAITRRTDRGLPVYDDAHDSDVFLISGFEDLVPVLRGNDPGEFDEYERDGYLVRRYRPRVEANFVLIERWSRLGEESDTHWRTISEDNVLNCYGMSAESRVSDPAEPGRIFSWLLCETRDGVGNAVRYEYKAEDGAGVDLGALSERQRGGRADPARGAGRYLKRIRYGNPEPLLGPDGHRPRVIQQPRWDAVDWLFEAVFDYGEHDPALPRPAEDQPWPVRADPFSTRRSGFEVRTYRTCRRVLMFHHFPDEPGVGRDCLVRSTDFEYGCQPSEVTDEVDPQGRRPAGEVPGADFTFLRSATTVNYRRADDARAGYLRGELPPVCFGYSQAVLGRTVHTLDRTSLQNLPDGLDEARYRWVALHGEGIPGVLSEHAGAWFYKPNLGPLAGHPVLGPTEPVAVRPNLDLRASGARLLDLAGDGRPDVVVLNGTRAGFYPHDEAYGWQEFQPFAARPPRSLDDPNARLVDLDGDGIADLAITELDAIEWYPSLGAGGFGPGQRLRTALDEQHGPRLVLAGDDQSIYLADMTGDGLTDLVRVRNGEVCYWPNLGYGRFGAKVGMDCAPRLDATDLFSQARVHLADIDGSGTADLVYVGSGRVLLAFNRSGNSWSRPVELPVFPHLEPASDVTVLDLTGNGTACLVWSSALPGDSGRQLQYLDLLSEGKPHLLTSVVNNLGLETRVRYASSHRQYLQDRAAGRPWLSTLPFPVQVVERVETIDRISRTRFVTRYTYHHPYFDGHEREMRGFALVEQWDTESYQAIAADDVVNADRASYVPPVHTKTWFHTGMVLGSEDLAAVFAALDGERADAYYRPPASASMDLVRHLPSTELPSGLDDDEWREACRALKGSMLRREVYAVDGSPASVHPYTVTEQNLVVRTVQRRGPNRHAVFFVHPGEMLTVHYERDPRDPRVQHELTLEVDRFGRARRRVTVSYGRQAPCGLPTGWDRDQQRTTRITYAEHRFTNAIENRLRWPDEYRLPMGSEQRSYELTGLTPASGDRFSLAEWQRDGCALVTGATEIGYRDQPDPSRPQRRLIEHVRSLYRSDDLGAAFGARPDGLLPLGTVEPLALPGVTTKLAYAGGMIEAIYRRDGQPLIADPRSVLVDEGGYLPGEDYRACGLFPATDPDGCWWVPEGRAYLSPSGTDDAEAELAFARQHFYLPHRFRDAFHRPLAPTETVIAFDRYDLLVRSSVDALGNRTLVGGLRPDGSEDPEQRGHDYRTLTPRLITDPNGNRKLAAVDVHGIVVGTAVQSKSGSTDGDSLDGFRPELPFADQQAVLTDPALAADLLGPATTRLMYDLFAYVRTAHEPQPSPPSITTLRRLTHESDLEPGERSRVGIGLTFSDGFGREIQHRVLAEPAADEPQRPRWRVSGWQVFNNKGKPVRQYEPFFSWDHRFEFGVAVGVSPVLLYDPAGRIVATLNPDGTFAKTVFTPWRVASWDANDTVLGEPGRDIDIAGYAAGYLAGQDEPWASWYRRRVDGQLGGDEQEAAEKASKHAGTPAVSHSDSLGRTFLTEVEAGTSAAPAPIRTRVETDIEGNKRVLRDGVGGLDSTGRAVMSWDYDLLSHHAYQHGMDAGRRWMLPDAVGKPIRMWDERGHEVRTRYDQLRRPVESVLVTAGPAGERVQVSTEVMSYGEQVEDGWARNLRTRLHHRADQSGSLTTLACDFKGNVLSSARQLAARHDVVLDWSAQAPRPELEEAVYLDTVRYDASDRPVETTLPHDAETGESRLQTRFNIGGFFEQVHARLFGETEPQAFVTASEHDAKGQRQRIAYANGTRTSYQYDPMTFRIRAIRTEGPSGLLQDLHYTYDPVGNITRVLDRAQQTIFFRNRVVSPSNDYTYDASYRLIEAAGREHLGQAGPSPWSARDADRLRLPQPGDGVAMARYVERYRYDEAGNVREVRHRSADPAQPGWRREFSFGSSNRLSQTTVGKSVESYAYDTHGNTVRMPTVAELAWDYKDQLQLSRSTPSPDGTPSQATWYSYDGSGTRVRKLTTSAGGRVRRERLYLGGIEIQRVHRGKRRGLVRQSLHVSAGGQRLAIVEQRNEIDDGTARRVQRYQLTNHLGSGVLEVDERARVIGFEEYSPYGSTSYQAVRSQRQAPKRYRFSGKERDCETGLYYFGARYYSPWLCRWASCDPIGVGDGVNVYSYVSGNPVLMVDATGHAGEKAVGLGDVILYADKVLNRAQVGANVQKDHAISQAILKEVLGPLANLYKEGRDLTVAVETGAAAGSTAARWHTVKSTLEAGVQATVRALQGGGRGWSLEAEVISPMIDVLKVANGAELTGRQGTAILSQLANLHATTTLQQTARILELTEAGKTAELATYVNSLARSTKGVAAWTRTLRGIATSENALAAAARVTALATKAAPLVARLAPVGRFLGRWAGPLGIGVGGLQIATARNTEERIDGGITVVSSALMMSKHPLAIAAGGGMMVGQALEHSLNVSEYASAAGMHVYEGLRGAGLNDTASFVIGGAATILATPSAIGYAAAAKVASWLR